jgi:hypothetical protein
MATATKPKPEVFKEHVHRFESKLTQLKQSTAGLPGDDHFDQFFKIIHRPGWTTIAEILLVETLIDNMLVQTQALAQLHQSLLAGAEQVGR